MSSIDLTKAGLELDLSDEVAVITLNRPDSLNSQLPHMWEGLAAIGRELPGTVRVVVLKGAGRAFSAGLDRAMFQPEGIPGVPGVLSLAHGSAATAEDQIGQWQRGFDWSSRPSFVSIAAVHGHAIGAGFQLALGCDLRIAADNAQFTMPEPTLGLVPDLGGTKRLVDLVGYARAAEICLTGRRVGADEALRIGLVNQVVGVDELQTTIDTLVTSLLAVNRDASAETKALLQAAASRPQSEQELAERQAQYRRLRSLLGLESEA